MVRRRTAPRLTTRRRPITTVLFRRTKARRRSCPINPMCLPPVVSALPSEPWAMWRPFAELPADSTAIVAAPLRSAGATLTSVVVSAVAAVASGAALAVGLGTDAAESARRQIGRPLSVIHLGLGYHGTAA